jgi:hypothetical protein
MMQTSGGRNRCNSRRRSGNAEARGITAGQFAVSWVLNSSFVSV